jgi:exosortase A-associated hydrolase 2
MQPVPRAEPFFLPAAGGQRFCMYHAPAGHARGALVYAHPFGDEMNRTRRLAAQQARALAALGIAVLLVDLHGCGDSSGDFLDARWETWIDDLGLASAWLEQRAGVRAGVWGARLGALLALDYARAAPRAPARLVLWQPVLSGAAFLNQFLRLRLAGDMLAEGAGASGGTRALRAQLAAGSALEVAGYTIAPQLAATLDGIEAARLALPGCPVHWFEVLAPGAAPGPASARVADAWRARGIDLALVPVACPQFWATQEIADCPQLLAATGAVFAEACDAV